MIRKNQNINPLNKKLVDFFEKQEITRDFSFFDENDFILIIEYYQNQNNLKSALNSSRIAMDIYPYNSEILFRRAKLLVQDDQHEESIELLEKALLVDPRNENIHILMGSIYNEIDEPELAIEHLDIALNLNDSNSSEIYLNKAYVYIQSEQFKEAIPNLKKALKSDPDNTTALLELINAYNEIDNVQECIYFYEKIIDKSPYSNTVWNNLGMLYDYLGMHEKAVEHYELSLALNDKFPQTYYYLGNSFIESEDYEQAILAYKNCIRFGKEDHLIYLQLGLAYAYLDKFEEARLFFKKSIEFDSDFSESWFGLGLTYANETYYSKSIPYFKRAIKLDPINDKYHHELANTYMFHQSPSLAEKHYKDALELNPFNTDCWIDYSLFLHDQSKSDEALNSLNEALVLNSEAPDIFYILSGLHFSLGNQNKGEYYLEMALEIDPDNFDILFENFPFLYSNVRIIELIDKYSK